MRKLNPKLRARKQPEVNDQQYAPVVEGREKNPDSWPDWFQENEAKFGSEWERKFAETILVRIPGLRPEIVEPQKWFRDFSGGNRYIDFTVEEGEEVRIALEVDGWDKTGTQAGQTHDEFDDWSYRELSMTAAGYVPLRISNRLIDRKTEDVQEMIRLQLEMQRKRAEAGRADAEKARKAEAELRKVAEEAKAARDASDRDQNAEQRFHELLAIRRKADAFRLDGIERRRVQQLQDENDRINQELDDEKRRREEAEKENRGMKFVIGAALAIVVVAVGAVFYFSQNDGGTDGHPLCDKAVATSEISDSNLGERVTVRGTVEDTKRLDGDNPAVFLNLGAPFPDQDLSVVIWGEKLSNWGNVPPEDRYDGREVAITGELETHDGSLQVEANSPNDVVVCP